MFSESGCPILAAFFAARVGLLISRKDPLRIFRQVSRCSLRKLLMWGQPPSAVRRAKLDLFACPVLRALSSSRDNAAKVDAAGISLGPALRRLRNRRRPYASPGAISRRHC